MARNRKRQIKRVETEKNGKAGYQPAEDLSVRSRQSQRTLQFGPSTSSLQRKDIVLWKHPFLTLQYSVTEAVLLLFENLKRLWSHWKIVLVITICFGGLLFGYYWPGAHQTIVAYVRRKLLWCFYWTGLGILSSIGLGTGLHTFLLYLGPHIASVTLAAYECESLKFPEPPYPDQIVCPYGNGNSANVSDEFSSSMAATAANTLSVSLWAIMSKVRLEAFLWGAGTALGELPPYFMSRAARLSGQEPDDEEYREFEQLIRHPSIHEQPSWLDKAKLSVEKMVERIGFFGILLCASVPNPLFDLAGITCGHFLVPFWTFFGATLIGKAVVKMHIQKLFVILTFSEHHVEHMIRLISHIPVFGTSLQTPFKEFLLQQKLKLHRKPGETIPPQTSFLKQLFEYIVTFMVAYFLVSIVNSFAQNYHKRLIKASKGTSKKDNSIKTN